jgi:hypothetical protein
MPQYRPPPGLKWLPRLGTNGKLYNANGPPGDKDSKGGGGGAGGQPEMDNSPMGFIRRYWYILLPLFLANFMGADPPAGAEGGPPPPGAAAAVEGGGAAAAPTASPGAAPKQRRGKRG